VKVLLADDDRVLTHLFSKQLRAKGVETVVAHDAMQALMHAMRPPQPDVIVLDLQMPGGTGVEALRKLKTSAKTSSIPVIVLSGSGDADTPAAVTTLGADQFLLKPIQGDTLYRALCAVLGQPAPES
jgi:DNA-binding response OmpR family regulator